MKLSKMTLSSIFKKPETILYPFEARFVPPGLKGHIENNLDTCILCGICEKRCPSGAIMVDKPNSTWSIDRFRCVQCTSCVQECPKDSLSMLPDYAPVAVEKSVSHYTKTQPSEDELAAKEAEKAAKIKTALETKAAREAAKKGE